MSTIAYINISLEIWGSILSFIIIICITLGKNIQDSSRWPFIRILGCNIVILLSDAAAWAFKGHMDLFSLLIVPVSNFLVYAFGYILLAMFIEYLVAYIAVRTPISKKYVYIVWALCIAAIFFVVINQFNHMYYLIDESNFYRRQSGFWFSQVWGILCMMVVASILTKYRSNLNRREMIAFASYIVLPVLAMSIQIFMYGIALLYIATTVSILLIYIGIQVEQAKMLKEKELQLAEERIAIMLSQIQPHFLFNTLTAISRLCDIDSLRAKSALIDFSHYLRRNLDSLTQKTLMPFEQELEHINIYLSLEKMRFGELLSVTYDLQTTDFLLPALTIQPLVENAVRYGVGKKESGGTVHIHTSETEQEVVIVITDDGAGFSSDPDSYQEPHRTHIGLQNVKSRLQAQCGGSLNIESTPGAGTKVTVTIPKETL